MSNLNECIYGETMVVHELLMSRNTDEITQPEIIGALANAMNRIAALEAAIESMKPYQREQAERSER